MIMRVSFVKAIYMVEESGHSSAMKGFNFSFKFSMSQ